MSYQQTNWQIREMISTDFQQGFSTQNGWHRPGNVPVGVDIRDKHELSDKFLGVFVFAVFLTREEIVYLAQKRIFC